MLEKDNPGQERWDENYPTGNGKVGGSGGVAVNRGGVDDDVCLDIVEKRWKYETWSGL